MGINSGYKTLTSSLFVTGSAVYLACKEQIADQFGFQAQKQLRGWKIIVFYGISRAEHLCIFEARDLRKCAVLYIFR
ncbi:hypothetical protein D3C87_2111650 [compost metagenome]